MNYFLTESKILTGKSQAETLTHWPSDSEVNTRIPIKPEVDKLLIVWFYTLIL